MCGTRENGDLPAKAAKVPGHQDAFLLVTRVMMMTPVTCDMSFVSSRMKQCLCVSPCSQHPFVCQSVGYLGHFSKHRQRSRCEPDSHCIRYVLWPGAQAKVTPRPQSFPSTDFIPGDGVQACPSFLFQPALALKHGRRSDWEPLFSRQLDRLSILTTPTRDRPPMRAKLHTAIPFPLSCTPVVRWGFGGENDSWIVNGCHGCHAHFLGKERDLCPIWTCDTLGRLRSAHRKSLDLDSFNGLC